MSPEEIGEIVSEGKPLIALVNIEVSHVKPNGEDNATFGQVLKVESCVKSVSHFVTITGMIKDFNDNWWVRVYNPFQNSEELYSWETFQAAWGKTNENPGLYYNVIIPSNEIP